LPILITSRESEVRYVTVKYFIYTLFLSSTYT